MSRETSGLPPAWIDVGTSDLFHDEDIAYAERLKEVGVQCTRFAGKTRGRESGLNSFDWAF